LTYTGAHKLSDKWGLHFEAQWRRNGLLLQRCQQLLLRTGIIYHINSSLNATVGYLFVETYPYGDFAVSRAFPENRIWEQIQLKTQVGIVEWINRFRLEQRFSKLPVKSGNTYILGDVVYTNRFRILNRISVPFKGSSIINKSFYATASQELFINFGKNIGTNYLDQTRTYGALGYKIPKVGRLEVGYMYQPIFRNNGTKVGHNHTLQIGLISNVDFYKKQAN
jgi:Protein of unknown function (DUF2490).